MEPEELDKEDTRETFSNFYIELWWEKSKCITFMWTFLFHRLLFVCCMQIDIMSIRIGIFLYG